MKYVAGECFIAGKSNCKLTTAVYGNVMNSTGSIIPLIWEYIKNGKTLSLYGEEMTRFLLDVEDAVDKLLPPAKNAARRFYDAIKPVRVYTEEEKQIRILRESLKIMDAEHAKRSILTNQPGSVEQVEHCSLPIAKEPQSNCYQECQMPVLQSEAQKPEIACQSPSECSSGSPLNVQKLHGSDHQCGQYCRALG
jgi:hypothetical protein